MGYISCSWVFKLFKFHWQLIISSAILCNFLLLDQTHLPCIFHHSLKHTVQITLSWSLMGKWTDFWRQTNSRKHQHRGTGDAVSWGNPSISALPQSHNHAVLLEKGGKHGTLTRHDRERCVLQRVTEMTFTAGIQFFYTVSDNLFCKRCSQLAHGATLLCFNSTSCSALKMNLKAVTLTWLKLFTPGNEIIFLT
jgi:hypothetical protein